MARTGQSIENPVTGQRIVWVQTAADTAGASLCFDLYLRAGAAVSAEHRHLRQIEHFVVIGGDLRVTVDRPFRTTWGSETRRPWKLARRSRWVNVSNADTHVRVTLSPALDTETFFETLFGLARDGKTNRKGLPGLARIAVAYRTLGDSCPRVTRPPVGVQDAVFAVAAPVGRMLGKRGVYARYSPDHAKA